MNTAKSIKFNFEQDLNQKLRSVTCDSDEENNVQYNLTRVIHHLITNIYSGYLC